VLQINVEVETLVLQHAHHLGARDPPAFVIPRPRDLLGDEWTPFKERKKGGVAQIANLQVGVDLNQGRQRG